MRSTDTIISMQDGWHFCTVVCINARLQATTTVGM